MKNKKFHPEQFQELSRAENFNYNGGGFAYDVGRLLRFYALSGASGTSVHIAVFDALLHTS